MTKAQDVLNKVKQINEASDEKAFLAIELDDKGEASAMEVDMGKGSLDKWSENFAPVAVDTLFFSGSEDNIEDLQEFMDSPKDVLSSGMVNDVFLIKKGDSKHITDKKKIASMLK